MPVTTDTIGYESPTAKRSRYVNLRRKVRSAIENAPRENRHDSRSTGGCKRYLTDNTLQLGVRVADSSYRRCAFNPCRTSERRGSYPAAEEIITSKRQILKKSEKFSNFSTLEIQGFYGFSERILEKIPIWGFCLLTLSSLGDIIPHVKINSHLRITNTRSCMSFVWLLILTDLILQKARAGFFTLTPNRKETTCLLQHWTKRLAKHWTESKHCSRGWSSLMVFKILVALNCQEILRENLRQNLIANVPEMPVRFIRRVIRKVRHPRPQGFRGQLRWRIHQAGMRQNEQMSQYILWRSRFGNQFMTLVAERLGINFMNWLQMCFVK